MHFEILVEDRSGQEALEVLVPKIIGKENSFKIHTYKGVGHVPKNLKPGADPTKRVLLNQLPRLLRGYGKTYPDGNCRVAIIVVCDLDDKCLKTFRKSLIDILDACDPKPETRFCIAIEEGEAWLLGDLTAIRTAYPSAKERPLTSYINDNICGTWEVLADAVYPGGAVKLASRGYQAIGAEKSQWAKNVSPHMDIDNNQSPSFCYFRKKLQELAD